MLSSGETSKRLKLAYPQNTLRGSLASTSRAVVKTRFGSSRILPPPGTYSQIDGFDIEPVPSENGKQEAILGFDFLHRTVGNVTDFDKIQLASIGETESRMWLAFLSLVTASNLEFQGAMVNGESTSAQRLRYRFPEQPPINFTQVADYHEKLAQLRGRDRIRFINSARAYQSAVSLMDLNPTLSFFVFIVAVECLSYYLGTGRKLRERFVNFIEKYIHPSVSAEKLDLMKFRHRLDTAYRIRNSFVHRGESLPGTVYLADRLNLPSVIYYVRGKERRAPGLVWLEKIVRMCLLGFLEERTRERLCKPKKPVFRNLARRAGAERLKKKKGISIEKGQPVTREMLELD